MKISVITPTRDRPSTFSLCRRWFERQTCADVEWIVVNDGEEAVYPNLPGRCTVVRRNASKTREPTNAENLVAGIAVATGELVMYLEDDDWFPPHYFSWIVNQHCQAASDVVASAGLRQYHMPSKRFLDKRHSGSARTGLASFCVRGARGILHLWQTALSCASANDPYIDKRFWATLPSGFNPLIVPVNGIVQLKGFPGRFITRKHVDFRGHEDDGDYGQLRTWVGNEDAEAIIETWESCGG